MRKRIEILIEKEKYNKCNSLRVAGQLALEARPPHPHCTGPSKTFMDAYLVGYKDKQ